MGNENITDITVIICVCVLFIIFYWKILGPNSSRILRNCVLFVFLLILFILTTEMIAKRHQQALDLPEYKHEFELQTPHLNTP